MGRVRLRDMNVAELLDRYGAIVTGRPVSEVLSRTRSRSYVARLSAVERELQARSDEEWLASLTKKERADPERAAQIVKLRRWTHGGSKQGGEPPLHVRDPRLRVVPTAELLERFAALAIKEDGSAIETRDRHYWKLEAITDELRWRDGETGCGRCSRSTHTLISPSAPGRRTRRGRLRLNCRGAGWTRSMTTAGLRRAGRPA